MSPSIKDQDIAAVVQKMAVLARMRFAESDLHRFAEKVQAVLSYVAQLNELDTTGIEPTSHAVETFGGLREDEVRPSLMCEPILAASPDRDGPFVQVPKVIDSE